ncbi:dihydrofolate reductase family protein [Hymenobacter properus]|uniref:Dihydrofolate reductase family protein n=1 Tax=Hymenobacter properus TaxID=2791026 RepID=A0A931BE24_9BACT|nr:dihydrofolate reductase family protein [Hymenobacter properus]MBF9140798.1 dihydrofolate reductase family protein [Hymenobacter properus]MBR7719607.1 dihydrofolate reductase family protein [Microvirga sp. SRT04]
MRKLRIIEHTSLDGVIQHDNSDGFAHGNWTTPYRTPAGLAAVVEIYGSRFDLLLGRRTYDAWATFWPQAGDSPMANGLNAATKYVATHRPESLDWGPAQDLGTDVLAHIRLLKATAGPDLLVCGSSTLTTLLLEQGLADELVLLVYPVLLGQGKRFFANQATPCELAFVSSQATSTGVLLNTYRYVGPLRA